MGTSATDTLVFLHLLADRKGVFSALRLAAAGAAADSLVPFLEHPDFQGLASQLPCLFYVDEVEQLSASLPSALVLAGCRPVSPDHVAREDRQLGDSYGAEIEWLDGDWYMSPPAKSAGNQAASHALAMQLVQLVAGEAENREIEAVLRRDPALSYQLLRLVNSVAIGAGRRITSFSQAIIILGRKQLRRWLNLMVFASREGDKRSTMLLAKVAVRSRAMELLARASGQHFSFQEEAFMVGMFSLLGALFGASTEDILRPLAISDAMRAALLTRDGELGNLLSLLEIAERGDFTALRKKLEAIQVVPGEFNLLMVQACNWMIGTVRDSRGVSHG